MNAPARIAVIANGAPPETPGERAALARCGACVCCDRLPPEGAPPLLQVVGDGDTLRAAVPPGLLHRESEQETCDLAKAIRWCRRHAPGARLDYFAVTGRREDHTLANLAHIYETAARAAVLTQAGRFDLFPAGAHTLPARPGGAVSLISLRPQRVTARGLAWPVEGLALESLWRATLNRAAASELRLVCEAPLFVYQPWSAP